MPEEQYLTVKEFASAAGVTVQSIYKRLNNQNDELNNFVVLVESKKRLKTEGLKIFIKPVVKPVEKKLNQVEQPDNPEIELLRETITTLQEQLTVKDKQIEQLTRQADALTAALNTALNTVNAAQALHAGDIQARITANEEADDDNGDDQSADTAEPMKKSLFSRIFGRKQ